MAKNLFKEIIPSILVTGKTAITDDNRGDYVPFVINRALSFHIDCLMPANIMNMMSHLDPIMQNEFLINSTRKYKRPFKKWLKREKDPNIEALKKHYGLSTAHAKEALLCLT